MCKDEQFPFANVNIVLGVLYVDGYDSCLIVCSGYWCM